jgi:tRNA-dihydrouridine synthase A
MIGRAIYQNPYFLVNIEREIFKVKNHPTREEIAEKLLQYLEKEVKLGTKVNHIMRHAVGLYYGQIGSKCWKRYLSDNMMARDSDFHKAKHIMTIVQNNEKANQKNL